MANVRESDLIKGVFSVDLEAHGDQRGRFAEIFRKEWFPQRSWEKVQWSRSESQAGTLRGLHYHHQQVDYWHCAAGRMRAGLVDLRQTSPTRGQAQIVELDQEQLTGLFIPAGVAHGFYAVTEMMLFYLVDNYYDGQDELGIAWNDPAIGLDWRAADTPILSERDGQNPLLADIPAANLPV